MPDQTFPDALPRKAPRPQKLAMRRRDLLAIARSFRREILRGGSPRLMCAAVCLPLQGYLAFCGLDTTRVEADFGEVNHVWLALPDGSILDPTADQFRTLDPTLPAVYCGPLPESYRRWMADAARTATPRPDRTESRLGSDTSD